MSSLKERIGRKVGYNKSWTRPGYQVKQSPSKQSQIRNQVPTAAGYESDQSSHEGDSGDRDRHPGFRNSSRPARKTSLLERMGLSPGVDSGDDDEDTEAVAKSLIERVGPVVADVETTYETLSKARTPDNVDPAEEDQESVQVLAKTLITEALDAPPLTSDSVCQSCILIVFLNCHCYASIGQYRHYPSQRPSQRQHGQRRPQLITSGP